MYGLFAAVVTFLVLISKSDWGSDMISSYRKSQRRLGDVKLH